MEKVDREPCPWRIVDDAGGAFVFGLAGGTVWHMIGGARNAPSGERLKQAISRTRARVPVLGGSFAVWGVLFSCCDCTLTYYRKKEDPWNAILSGAATGGILAARAGMKAAGKSALVGGVILAAIEGLNLVVMRVVMPYFEKQQTVEVDTLMPPVDPLKPRNPIKRKPLFDRNADPSSSPLLTGGSGFGSFGGGGGFASPSSSSSSSGQWDAPGFGTEPSMKTPDPAAETGSSWKFW